MSKNTSTATHHFPAPLGHIVLERDLLNATQVRECLYQLRERLDAGENTSLEAVMIELGYLTREQCDALHAELQRRTYAIAGYAIQSTIGLGAVGTVYRARQIAMEREVALKVLHPYLTEDASVVREYLSEARAVARLNHQHIVQGIDVGQSGKYYFFSMELLTGGNLATRLHHGGSLTEKEALIYLYQTTLALEHAWREGLVHRDLKPANLMLDGRGQIKVTDFGLACVAGEREEAYDGRRVVRGTPHYVSPEQITDPDTLDCRSDLYSLGATFYHLLSACPPFSGKDAKDLMLSRLRTEPLLLRERKPEISVGVSDLIARLMARKPEDRFQTPEELRKALDALGVDPKDAGDLLGAVRKNQEKTSQRRTTSTRSVQRTRTKTGTTALLRTTSFPAWFWILIGLIGAVILFILVLLLYR